MHRARVLAVAGALAVSLVAGSRPGIVGDGAEYVAQALNFSALEGPPLAPERLPIIQPKVAEVDAGFTEWDITSSTYASARGGLDFVHFWFYALVATPAVWLVTAVGAPLTMAFALTNLLLLGTALWVAFPRIGIAGAILLFAGPIIWWIDKAHTEAFTFALLTTAMALAADRPWWALVAVGAAATQNPPISAALGLLAVAMVVERPSRLRDLRFWAGAVGGGVLALLHTAYTQVRHGTPSLLLSSTRSDVPSLAELSAVVLDTNMGLIGNYPVLLIVGLVGTIVAARQDVRIFVSPRSIAVAAIGLLFLYSFAQAVNQHSGGTPSLSRYALWLVPLFVPLLAFLHQRGGSGWQRFIRAAAGVSAGISVFAFHPSVPENSRQPTWLAAVLWEHAPGLSNPLPEVFMETNLGEERPWVPVVAGACTKILIAGRGTDEGTWPMPCYPQPIPEECRARSAICYANWTGRGYDFVRAPGRWNGVAPLRRERVWPARAEAFAREYYDAWGWRESGLNPPGFDFIRQTQSVRATMIGRPDRFLMVLTEIRDGAFVRMRPTQPLRGAVWDPSTGGLVRELHLDPGTREDAIVVDVPAGLPVLLVTLTAG